jgi:hypothetical protein
VQVGVQLWAGLALTSDSCAHHSGQVRFLAKQRAPWLRNL